MPKRVVDGAGVWKSDKIAAIQPAWMRAEYANLLPLALANGTFEATPRRVWSEVYAYNRPEITPDKVEQILAELERVKLLFRWTNESTGKEWGYWTGINKSGRLPSQSRLNKKHEAIGEVPPAELLEKFLANGQPVVSQRPPNGEDGFGFGTGFGTGTGTGKDSLSEAKPSDEKKSPKSKHVPSDAGKRLASLLKTLILRNTPNAKVTDSQLDKWAETADAMLRLDGRSESEVSDLITWTQHDNFWMVNVRSMGTLREKYDQLWLKRKNGRGISTTAPTSGHAPRPVDDLPLSERMAQERAHAQ